MKTSAFRVFFLLLLASHLLSSCSSSQPFYFGKNTGSFGDSSRKKNEPAQPADLATMVQADASATRLPLLNADQFTKKTAVDNFGPVTGNLKINKLTRRQQRQLQQRLAAVLDTTKKRNRVTIQTNEKKIDDLRNEAERLKESVKAERNGDKVVVSFDDPQSSLSKEAKILIIVVAALLLVALLSLPIIGPVLGIVLGVAVVAAALALVLGIVEIS